MGLRLADFEALTPEEFVEIWNRWREREEMLQRAEWERVRMQCCCILQPYSRDAIRPVDVMRFPWDNRPDEADDKQAGHDMTREEILERYRAAKAAAGLH